MSEWFAGYAIGLIIGSWFAYRSDLQGILLFNTLILLLSLVYLVFFPPEREI